MKKLLLAFLLFPFVPVQAQQYPEVTNVEKHLQYGIINPGPLQIGSVFIYPGLLPLPLFSTAPPPVVSAFYLLLLTIQNTPFDDQKVRVAKQFIESNGIYSLHLLDILYLIPFDSDRLELAKSAYPYIIDKQNFLILVNALEFISSRRELTEYVQGL